MVGLGQRSSLSSTRKKIPYRKLSLAIVLAACSVVTQAGKITSTTSASGAEGFGGWNLNNVEVALDGTPGSVGEVLTSWFDELTGAYSFAPDSDFSYQAAVADAESGGTVMGYALAKDWPIGEPAGIKIVNDDFDVKEGRPTNCVMSTSYLDDHFLDTAEPLQVLCSGPFQSHKRYKLAMLPTTVDGGNSDSVDLVFNVEAEEGSRDYQIFQKINNWTNSRLEGFTIEVGFGVGIDFELASSNVDVGVANLSLAVPESVWNAKQLANFSAGLFGPEDTKHDRPAGYFDPVDSAGFFIDEYPVDSGVTDALHATTTLGSDYVDVPAGANAAANQFGKWIPNSMLPYGIFFDDDGDPETDAELKYWYGYNPDIAALGWMTGAEFGFQAVDNVVIAGLGPDLLYTMGPIDDLVNIGLNYIVTVGDVSSFPDSQFTVRITPTKDSTAQADPLYVGVLPVPALGFDSADGVVSITPSPEFAIGTSLIARVADADLTATVDVLVSTDDPLVADQTLTLVEQGEGRAVFTGEVPAAFSQVALGSTVTLTYTDANDGVNADVVKTADTLAVVDLNFGIIQYSSATYTVAEGDGTVIVTVERLGSTVAEATVEYSTVYNTAIGNEDYEAITGSLTFAPTEISQTIEIVLIDDSLHEDDESFNIILSNVQGGAVLGNDNIAEVIISDDDPIVVQFSEAAYTVAEEAASLVVTVERSSSLGALTVDYATTPTGAFSDVDFTAANGTLTFADGESSKEIQLSILEDTVVEADETFSVTLSNVQADAVIGAQSTTVITITDDDVAVVATSSSGGGGGAINPLFMLLMALYGVLLVNRRRS